MRIRVTGQLNPRLVELDKLFDLDQVAANDALEGVDVQFRRHEETSFRSEGASSGAPWKSLSPEYKKRKDRLFGEATAFNVALARARGRRRLAGAALSRVLGAENKILQLTGDMRRAFTMAGGDHIAQAYRGARGWVLKIGAQGAAYFGYQVEAGRDPIQHTDPQWRAYLQEVQKRLIPHVMRRFRALHAFRLRRVA